MGKILQRSAKIMLSNIFIFLSDLHHNSDGFLPPLETVLLACLVTFSPSRLVNQSHCCYAVNVTNYVTWYSGFEICATTTSSLYIGTGHHSGFLFSGCKVDLRIVFDTNPT